MEESQAPTVLGEDLYDDPSQLSQALRQRACSDKQFHFTTSTESQNSARHTAAASGELQQSPRAFPHQPVGPALFDRAPSPRRAAHTDHVQPALPKNNSAPTSTGYLREALGGLKMHSFNMMDAPGDTQPDSQMMKTWTSGIYSTTDENDILNPKSLFVEHDDDNGDDLPTDDMDLVASSQDNRIPTPTSPTVIDADEHGDFAQNSLAPTSPLKFQTPALAARKTGNSSQMLSSAVRMDTTPGTVASANLFFPSLSNAGEGGAQQISLTQAFNNTQAPTSPVVGAAAAGTDEIVFSRPSPNFSHMRHSSPIPAYSSPIKATQPETPKSDPVVRSSSEPRTEYITMKQSQERRNPSAGDGHTVLAEQDSWGELSRQFKAKRAREHAHRQAARSLSAISAPTPVLSRSGSRRSVNTGYPSPEKSKTSRSGVHGEADDDDVTMDEPSQATTADEVDEHNADDSADELSQSAPHTARTVVRHNSDNNVQVPKTSSHPHRTSSAQHSRNSTQQTMQSSQLHQEHQPQQNPREAFRPQSSKEFIAVMDSQPDATVDSVPRPKSLRFPSSPSINQYSINQTTMATKTGYTSQAISSSIPPMPPKSRSEENVIPEDEERVPSSPPLLPPDDAEAGDGDMEYDEHTYDEYAEGVVEKGTPVSASIEDTIMEEEDELPLAKEEFAEEEVRDQVDEGELGEDGPETTHAQTDRVPETLEPYEPADKMLEDDQPQQHITGTHRKPPQMRRQNTIPETDALDETQPSFFPDRISGEVSPGDTHRGDGTNSTRAFQTAQEAHHGSQPNMPAPVSSRDNGSDAIPESNRIRSIDDIYNLPETQRSAAEEDVEMPRLSGLEDDEGDAFIPHTSPALPSAKRRKVTYTAKRSAFRSPAKAITDTESLSDPPPSPRLDQFQQALEDTQPSAMTLEREDQGALAASRVREEAQAPYVRTTSLKSKALPRPSKPQNQRQGALKSVSREVLQSMSSPVNSPTKSKGAVRARTSTPVTPTKPRDVVTENAADVDMADADNESVVPVSSVVQSFNVEKTLETPSQRGGTPLAEVSVPNRVFASWPGSHYYPATCIGRATSRQLQIRYDDGNTTFMDAAHVRSLDLCKGDHVKVDETGFKDRIDDLDGEEFPTTDQRGHATVILEERPRESLPRAKALQQAEHISVPMASIYLTASLWKRLRDRSFTFSPIISPAKSTSRIGTPITDPLTTPSFTRRGTAAPSLLKDVTTRAASVASTARSSSGVFTNMAFVLTSTTADVDKDAISRLIKSNGGQVLEQGFHELFDYESEEAPNSSQGRRRSASVFEGSSGLVLKNAYKDMGFVALISDAHSRSTKYIQALALNVPCLHLRWIHDSLNASRAAPFTRYLLPAGVSKFLDPNGVVRSRTMTPYDPASDDVSFAQIIQHRDLLFRDQNVLLVTGKSKKEIEKRQPFFFLSHALGSRSVGRCADVADAADTLTDGKWDWIYVDNGERGVAEAAVELLGTGKLAANGKSKKGAKKRKRDVDGEIQEELLLRKGLVSGKMVRITCAEFVIQSLILGAMIEE
ncbi:BRCT domain containing protein [Stemphylium lycopersici]|nr:BRCT domain containing protein [Stemphylium lycopersici]